MPVIVRKVSLVIFLEKLLLDLVKQVILTGRVDADFVDFYVRSHGTIFLPRFDPVHVNLVHDRAVEFWDFPEAYDDNKMLWENYVSYHEALIQSINNQIAQAPGKVYLFGAHVFSQFLLSFGLDRSKIECIIDNSSLKQGKRLYGTDLMVASPSTLKDEVNPTVILRTGVFNTEIKQDILTNINPGTIFLE